MAFLKAVEKCAALLKLTVLKGRKETAACGRRFFTWKKLWYGELCCAQLQQLKTMRAWDRLTTASRAGQAARQHRQHTTLTMAARSLQRHRSHVTGDVLKTNPESSGIPLSPTHVARERAREFAEASCWIKGPARTGLHVNQSKNGMAR